MLPFKRQLTLGRSESNPPPQWAYLLLVESVSASLCFDQDRPEICVYRREWRRVRTEPCELRVMPIALGLALQYRARKQAFPPERHQPLGV
jgi:hypothetical protein